MRYTINVGLLLTVLFLILMPNEKVLDSFQNPENLYSAVAQAETGSFAEPWIRTTAKDTPGGSSAFGPVQITQGKALDYAKRGILSPESKDFVELFMNPMYEDFLKYGNEPKLEGYDKEFDYGGTGYFPEDAQNAYRQLANEMLAYDYEKSKSAENPLDAFIRSWRGVGAAEDPRYYQSVKEFLQGAEDGQ